MNKLKLGVLALTALLWALSGTAQEQEDNKWMRYPAISPDGSEIVFSYMGNLYKVASGGGTAVPLTVHSAFESRPTWRPDGKEIAYASDRHGNMDVFTIPAEGGKSTRVTHYSKNDIPEDYSANGDRIYFTSNRVFNKENAQFPYGRFVLLYSAAIDGSDVREEIPFPVERISVSPDGSKILYQDLKGYEDYWRKKHRSSVTRDIWVFDTETRKHTQLTDFEGEDRNPIWAPDGETIYFLSEESGTINIWKTSLSNPTQKTQITDFDLHPVRFLSISDAGVLSFGYHGEIYTLEEGNEPKKLNVRIPYVEKAEQVSREVLSSGATDMAVSPNGKEVAFVVRGEVFVTSVESGATKQITDTPEQERSVSFSPCGRKLLYAGERNGSWNLYETTIKDDSEKYFFASTLLEEKTILATEAETFQPAYSPDGKEVAFIEERTTLRVLNLDSKKARTVLPAKYNYSYSDGDQYYEWSPDSKWLLVTFITRERWVSEMGLVDASGEKEVINLSNSGYAEAKPMWMRNGEGLIFMSDRNGYRSHGSHGATRDIYAMHFTQEAYEKFKLDKEAFELLTEREKEEKKEEEKDDKKKKKKSKSDDDDKDLIKIEWEGLEDRVTRLTLSSGFIGDMVLSNDGEKLYYVASRDGGADLWELSVRDRKVKNVTFLQGGGSLELDKDGKNIFVRSRGRLFTMKLGDSNPKPIAFRAEMTLDREKERAYIFDHMWRQVLKKFYVKDLHGTEWEKLRGEYEPLLAHINNNYDFAEMSSELLGELNGSHTGMRYNHRDSKGDQTASLGVIPGKFESGKGLEIAEIMDKSPLLREKGEVKDGDFIRAINGEEIQHLEHYHALLNHQSGKETVLDLSSGKRIKVRPISLGAESNLLYERWVKGRRAAIEELSDGRLGYVHVRGMNSPSFREVYSELLGRYNDKEAVVVDTRFNGGGWLHDDLATLLSGEQYVKLVPRDQVIGSEPQKKWQKPSAVLLGEGNYSDAHFFPVAYRALNIGKTVGMPVPGTTTAVWWETQIDNSLVFGIPQVGVKDMDGNYLENQQFEPDMKVKNMPGETIEGRDAQLEKAVEVLLQELDN
ncbi:MAG: DPP IV N-terminal domain-containing protein [Cyclobacteriaceae bacterium]|nr:PD40 domain-containing protein [Cyclobacteriaceae bacterium]MCH8516876.1 DPP IV N-terminal domain-containing protein [Cyclobacteriaceae bacterium]